MTATETALRQALDPLYDAIEQVLLHYRSDAWVDESGDPFPLVDLLTPSPSKDIAEGKHQIRLICDAIYNDDGVRAALAAPPQEAQAEPSCEVLCRAIDLLGEYRATGVDVAWTALGQRAQSAIRDLRKLDTAMAADTSAQALAVVRELVAADDALKAAQQQWVRDHPPMPVGHIGSWQTKMTFPDPAMEDASGKLAAAWASARAIVGVAT